MDMVLSIVGVVAVAVTAIVAVRHILETYTRKVTIWDYQSGVHYKNGRFVGGLKAGKHRFWGSGHHVVVHDDRLAQFVVQGQELITADSAPLKISAVVFYKVVNARKLIESADDGIAVLYTEVQLALRDVIGAETVDAVLENKVSYGTLLAERVREAAETVGVNLERVEIRDVMLGGDLKRVYAGVIHARKEAEAAMETARGEAAALRTMANAARLFQNNPELLKLKYLQTIGEAGRGMGSSLVMGLPNWLTAGAPQE